MSLTIKHIPILYDKEADKFIENADNSYIMKDSIDFNKEMESMKIILEKAKMKNK